MKMDQKDPNLLQETRKISNKLLNIIPNELEKEQIKPKVSERREILNIRAEINEIETKKH